MLLCLGADDTLYMPHWGARGSTQRAADYLPSVPLNRPSEASFLDGQPLAYPVHGMATFKETCLVVSTEDGARGARFSFVEDRVVPEGLNLVFEDALLHLRLTLRFAVAGDVLVRSAVVENGGTQSLRLE